MKSDLPIRTRDLLMDAQAMEKEGFFIPAMLCYSCFLEQVLLAKYIHTLKKQNPRKAKQEIDEILRIKDSGDLTLGRVLNKVKPILNNEIDSLCKEIKGIRNTLVAHPYFVMPLDPTNRYKLAFYDVSNYRKIIRRLYSLTKSKGILTKENTRKIRNFLNCGSPLSRIKRIEDDARVIENLILKALCMWMGKKVKEVSSRIPINKNGLNRWIHTTS